MDKLFARSPPDLSVSAHVKRPDVPDVAGRHVVSTQLDARARRETAGCRQVIQNHSLWDRVPSYGRVCEKRGVSPSILAAFKNLTLKKRNHPIHISYHCLEYGHAAGWNHSPRMGHRGSGSLFGFPFLRCRTRKLFSDFDNFQADFGIADIEKWRLTTGVITVLAQ